jgi:hypothetical protein
LPGEPGHATPPLSDSRQVPRAGFARRRGGLHRGQLVRPDQRHAPGGQPSCRHRFAAQPVEPAALAALTDELQLETSSRGLAFAHIDYFREAGIQACAGPATYLPCHREISYPEAAGDTVTTGLMDNLTGSAHYRSFISEHPNVYGFNGKLADNLPMGKLNRSCPKPGSFAMTAWAEPVITTNGDTLSEGCGQCHIGGQYQAPFGEMMPMYRTLAAEQDAIDCLICHAAAYDLNRKQVVRDGNGRQRWGQDRSLRAALSVTAPTAEPGHASPAKRAIFPRCRRTMSPGATSATRTSSPAPGSTSTTTP